MNLGTTLLLALLIVFTFHLCVRGLGVPENIVWTHHIAFPGDGQFEFKWSNRDPEWVTMEIRAKTKGYVGIGWSPKGGMPGADIVMGWIDESGVTHLKDYHAITNGAPIEDAQQDYVLIYGRETEEGTILGFKRKWDTCDPNDISIGEDTMRVIWAWSPEDPELGQPLHHHGFGDRRGVRSGYMRTPAKPLKFPEENSSDTTTQYWDITMYNVDVAKTETRYLCRIYQFPKLSKKHHIIGYRPLIAPESVAYVHHINVYACHVPEALGRTDDIFDKYLNHPGADCLSPVSPIEWREYCAAFKMAVAVGAEGDIYPPHIGDPIGNELGENMYLKLEVHYENPYGHQLMDSSGIRIYYTEKLREFDVAMLFAGYRRTPFLSIPPFQNDFRIYGHCSSDCTALGFPPKGIKVFSILLHAHLTARKLILRHIRNGKELEPLAYDNHYDFNYQEYRKLKEEVTILPGDELIMECEYETKSNNTFIFGGLSTREEMCEAFLYYYPKSSLIDCRSQPEYSAYLNVLGGVQNATGSFLRGINIPYDPALLPADKQALALPDDVYIMQFASEKNLFKGLTIRKPANLAGENLFNYMSSLYWRNTTFAKMVEEKWRAAPRYMHCSGAHGDRIKIPKHILKIGDYEKRVPEASHCPAGNPARRINSDFILIFVTIILVTFVQVN